MLIYIYIYIYIYTVYNCIQVDCTYKSTPKFSPQIVEKMQDLRISRPLFSGLISKFILWHATKHPRDSSIDGLFPPAMFIDLTRLPPSASDCPTAQLPFSLLYRPHCRTAVWIMIKLVRPIVQSSHVCCHPAWPPDHLPVSYYVADAALRFKLRRSKYSVGCFNWVAWSWI